MLSLLEVKVFFKAKAVEINAKDKVIHGDLLRLLGSHYNVDI